MPASVLLFWALSLDESQGHKEPRLVPTSLGREVLQLACAGDNSHERAKLEAQLTPGSPKAITEETLRSLDL